ncbi:hypothetical protein [Herbiconiux sp. VKM Ac-2851]|uniref:hypothetical protein n=1 Tax=Herbiconiux sp. VKM Ac-2851 TaxID=2739025 RepID=UPI0015644EB9|nr:hypothetical protein [Herbiconiux sp. VKM Ac-2851]NQX34463.1 hypothetical protein [Herbiconiux sp. VKM Ac-2851]
MTRTEIMSSRSGGEGSAPEGAGSGSPATGGAPIAVAPALHELMSPEQNVQRIMRTGTVWFGVAVGATAVVLGLLLSAGWRPAMLNPSEGVLWWVGSFLVVLSIGLIGWSGCPILEVDVPTADRNKTRTMQLGTMLFIVGGAFAMFAVLMGPAL